MSKSSTKNIRLLIVDDHVLFRESVSRLLQAEPGFNVLGDCGSSAEAIRIIDTQEIDMVLLDIDLGHESGIELLETLQAKRFGGKVLLVTAGVNENEVPSLIRKGIAGIFLKHGSPALLMQGIRETMHGRVLFDQSLLRRSLQASDDCRSSQGRAQLTEREKLVLSHIFEGLANKQIGDRLRISESAVKACLQQPFAKTGVRTRSQLVRIALEQYRDQI